MTLKAYLKILIICAIIAWAIFIATFFVETNFYLRCLSLFLGLSSTFSFLEFVVRVRRKKRPLFRQLAIAFRHSLWLAIIVVGFLLFSYFGIFFLPNALLLLVVLGLMEVFFRMSDKKYQT